MSLIVVIVAVIVILLFLIVFTFGFFMGLGRKKKDIAILEKEQEIQKKTHETIISRLLYDDKGEKIEKKGESSILPVKIINRGYSRIKKYIKFKQIVADLKEVDVVKYIRKYLLSYIGIGVLIFGFGYFIKFAVAAEYVPIVGRFMISVLVSVLLILISHSFRKKYKTFSSIIMGGAIGSLYITFAISFYTYNIFSNIQIFSVFFLLTAFSVILAIVYNRFELLLLALVAGFVSPIFSNFDFTDIRILMIYIILLDIGAIIVSARYRNFFIRLIPSLFTGGYLLLWMRFCLQNNSFIGIDINFLLLNLVYFVLLFLAVIYNVRKKVTYQPYELMIVLVINLIYYSIGMYMLNVLNPDYKGAFTALVAVYNIIGLIILLIIRKDSAEQLIYFFAITALLFLTLIPPVELVGKSITMIWAIETVLLMWVSIKLKIQMLKFASTFLMIGLIASFAMDVIENYLEISYNAPDKRVLLNQSFISGIMTSFGLGLNVILIGKSQDRFLIKPIKMSHLRAFISVVALGALYVSLNSEILYQLTLSIRDESLLDMYMGIFNYSFILVAVIILTIINKPSLRIIVGIIAILATTLFFIIYLYDIITVRDHLLLSLTITKQNFIYHLILISLIIFIIFFAYINVSRISDIWKRSSQWIITILLMSVLITELDHLAVINNHGSGIPKSSILSNVHYFYYTMFWTFAALVLSVSGMLLKDKELVRVSIFVAFAALVKLFAYDISNIETWERTFSYIIIGFVVLFIAFVRQRMFEKLIKEETQQSV